MNAVEQFNAYRGKMNEEILASDNLILKRIFNLDTNAYAPGVLDIKTKELIGLTCSLVQQRERICTRSSGESGRGAGYGRTVLRRWLGEKRQGRMRRPTPRRA